MFIKETEVPQVDILIGTNLASFERPDTRGKRFGAKAWFRLPSLVEFFTGRELYSKNEYENLDTLDFQFQVSKRIRNIISLILEKFSDKNIDDWTSEYYTFIMKKNV
jgi:hypothetical protein